MKKKEKTENYVRTRYAASSPEYRFGTRLSTEMKKKGLSTSKLAELMNVSESAVKDWRQHYTIPKQAHLDELCRIFAPCSADYFLGTIDAPNYDVKYIMEYTGLSAAAVQYLHDLNACSSSPEVKEKSKRIYLEMFGTDMFSDFLDVLNRLLCNESGFTEVLTHILDAERMKSEYDGFSDSLPREASAEETNEYINKQSLRELYYEKDKQFATEGFRDFVESFLPSIR